MRWVSAYRMKGRTATSALVAASRSSCFWLFGSLPRYRQHHAVHLGGRVEHSDAALLEVLGDGGVEHQMPAVQRGVLHRLGDLLGVVADTRRTPHVEHGVVVVRVVHGEPGFDVRIHVLQVRQLALVELLVHAGLDLALVRGGGGHDHVVAGITRGQLGVRALRCCRSC